MNSSRNTEKEPLDTMNDDEIIMSSDEDDEIIIEEKEQLDTVSDDEIIIEEPLSSQSTEEYLPIENNQKDSLTKIQIERLDTMSDDDCIVKAVATDPLLQQSQMDPSTTNEVDRIFEAVIVNDNENCQSKSDQNNQDHYNANKTNSNSRKSLVFKEMELRSLLQSWELMDLLDYFIGMYYLSQKSK